MKHDKIDNKSNIILLFPDQWRGDCLSHLGHPDAYTPYLDQLAAEGISYRRAFSPAPTCIPARMAMLSGLNPWNNGRTGFDQKTEWKPQQSLPEILRNNGYQTMQVGKTHFSPMRASLGFETNDLYEASVREPNFKSDYHEDLEKNIPLVRDAALTRDPNNWQVNPWTEQREWHCSEWITRKAIERLKKRDPQRPFFLQIGWHRPHPPFDPPQDVWENWRERELTPAYCGDWVNEEQHHQQFWPRSEHHQYPQDEFQALQAKRAYYASIQHVDEQIGQIMFALNQLELKENTTLIFSSDHGEFIGDHRRWNKAQPNSASSRIPLIVRPSAIVQKKKEINKFRGSLVDRPCALTDIFASCLDIADISKPKHCNAESFIPPSAQNNTKDYATEERIVHSEHHAQHSGWHALMNKDWAYHWHSDGREYLFHHALDPQELHNCLDEHPEMHHFFQKELIRQLHERGCGTSNGKELIIGHNIGTTQKR